MTIGIAAIFAVWTAPSGGEGLGAFKIGEPFADIKEYSDYPFSHLYDHGRLLGKAITDNWQYRVLCNRINQGALHKAELAEGYSLYSVMAVVFTDFNTKPDYTKTQIFPARNEKEAERKMILAFCRELLSTGVEHEYIFPDESGIVKIKAVKKNDRQKSG